jgi:Flp pilus assembly secretin CpaC
MKATTTFKAAAAALLLVLSTGSVSLHAQTLTQTAPANQRVPLTAGRSTVLTTDFDITRIAVTNPAIADAVVVQPREVLVDGKAPGTISLIIWGQAGQRLQYDVVVEQPVAALEQQLRLLFPGEEIQIALNADAIVLSGRVSSTQTMLRAAEIRRERRPAGDAPGAVRGGQPPRIDRARLEHLHWTVRRQKLDRPRNHATVSCA